MKTVIFVQSKTHLNLESPRNTPIMAVTTRLTSVTKRTPLREARLPPAAHLQKVTVLNALVATKKIPVTSATAHIVNIEDSTVLPSIEQTTKSRAVASSDRWPKVLATTNIKVSLVTTRLKSKLWSATSATNRAGSSVILQVAILATMSVNAT